MKYHTLRPVLVAVFFFSFAALNMSPGQEWARKMFKEQKHEFGNVQLGDIPEFRFELENIYNEEIRIASVHSSCGCTIATATKKSLKTREKGEIVCRFNTPAVGRGFKQATITIRFDRPFVGECQLIVSGTIVTGISVTPASIDFGQITEHKFPVKTIQISHNGNPNFRIRDVQSSFSHISVQVKETSRRGNFVSYELTTQLKESAPKGFNQGELYVVVEENPFRRSRNGSPILRKIPVKFNAKVVSSLKIAPETLALGKVEQGAEVSHKVLLTSDKPFKIKDVRCHSEAFKVETDNQELKKMHIVEIAYTGESTPGRHECELNFFVEYEDQQPEISDASIASATLKAFVEVIAQ